MFKIFSQYPRLLHLLEIIFTAAVYFFLARLCLLLQFQNSNASPVWAPSGFAFAMILLRGKRIIPGILIGAFAANAVTFINNNVELSTAVWVSAVISLGNTGEALAGFYLLRKNPGIIDNYLQKVRDIYRFLLVAFLMCLVSSFIGSTIVFLAGISLPGQYMLVLLNWWLGDFSGILLITPFILLWVEAFRTRDYFFTRSWNWALENTILFMLVLVWSGIIFGNLFSLPSIFKWAYWILPVLVLAAVRFNQIATITALILCSVIAILGTVNDQGPFATLPFNEALLTVQAFVSIMAITILVLHASVNERRKTEIILRETSNQLEIRVKERTTELEEKNRELEKSSKELKQANMALGEQKSFAELLIESSPDLIMACNRQFQITAWNKKSEEHTGLSKEQVMGKHALELFHEYNNEKWLGLINEVFHGKNLYFPKIEFQRVPGWGEIFMIPLRNMQLEIIGLLTITRNITDKITLSSDLEQKNADLERLNKELESFVFVASHDLQEPLRKIQIFSNRILETEVDTLSEHGKDYFSRIEIASGRMQQLILDLLAYSRTNTIKKHFEKTDLNQLLEQVKIDLKEKITETNTLIENTGMPHLNIIPFQFRQLFTNLINNSIKFSKPGIPPRIFIKSSITNGADVNIHNTHQKIYHHISIADNGIGFQHAYKEQIFGLFQRLHGRNEYEGTGIGLSICKKIIENHHGIIAAESEPGKGATFHIYLPVS